MANTNTEIKIKFWDFIKLKPYRNYLLTADAKGWLIGMAFLALLLAVSEGVIWGYLVQNYFFSDDTEYSKYLVPLSIGLAFAVVIWLIDAQIVNMDLSYYDKVEEKEGVSKFTHFRNLISKYIWNKPTFVLLSRIAIIITSVYFTAPALTKLVLNDEVEALIDKERFDLKTSLYSKVDSSYNNRIKTLQTDKRNLENELEKEIAGTRESTGSLRGDGPVAEQIRVRIQDKKDEISNLTNQKREEYKLIDDDNFDELKTRYNTYIDGVTTASMREKAYEKVLQDKNNKFLSDIAKTAIFLVFSAFLLFKFFQPKTVSNYYNNKLQDSHLEYRRGELDHLVLAAKLPVFNDNGGMSNHKYFEFYERIYLPTLFDEFDTIKIQSYKKKADKIKFMKSELKMKETSMQELRDRELEMNTRIEETQAEIATIKAEKKEVVRKIESLSELVRSEFNSVEANNSLKELRTQINRMEKDLTLKQNSIEKLSKKEKKFASNIVIDEELINELKEKIYKMETDLFDEL